MSDYIIDLRWRCSVFGGRGGNSWNEDVVKENKYSLLIGWIDILYTQNMDYFTTVTTSPIYTQNHVKTRRILLNG